MSLELKKKSYKIYVYFKKNKYISLFIEQAFLTF